MFNRPPSVAFALTASAAADHAVYLADGKPSRIIRYIVANNLSAHIAVFGDHSVIAFANPHEASLFQCDMAGEIEQYVSTI